MNGFDLSHYELYITSVPGVGSFSGRFAFASAVESIKKTVSAPYMVTGVRRLSNGTLQSSIKSFDLHARHIQENLVNLPHHLTDYITGHSEAARQEADALVKLGIEVELRPILAVIEPA